MNIEEPLTENLRNANFLAYKIRGVFVSNTTLFAFNIGIEQQRVNVIFQDLRPM